MSGVRSSKDWLHYIGIYTLRSRIIGSYGWSVCNVWATSIIFLPLLSVYACPYCLRGKHFTNWRAWNSWGSWWCHWNPQSKVERNECTSDVCLLLSVVTFPQSCSSGPSLRSDVFHSGLHQLTIKITLEDMPTGQSDLGNSCLLLMTIFRK